MSRIDEKSPKDCARKQLALDLNKRLKLLFYSVALFLLMVLTIMFLVWLNLHPRNPHLSLQKVDIIKLNATGPISSVRITLLSHNPNKRVGIYYDRFLMHASYKGKQITPESTIAPFYQGYGETNPISTLLPVASYIRKTEDHVILSLEARALLRWKVGTWVSWRYRFGVNCVTDATHAVLPRDAKFSSKQGSLCSTSV